VRVESSKRLEREKKTTSDPCNRGGDRDVVGIYKTSAAEDQITAYRCCAQVDCAIGLEAAAQHYPVLHLDSRSINRKIHPCKIVIERRLRVPEMSLPKIHISVNPAPTNVDLATGM